MFIFSGEVLVGHAPNTQLILYDISTPVDIPDTITGTLFITNYQLCFRPIPFLVEKVYSIYQYKLLSRNKFYALH